MLSCSYDHVLAGNHGIIASKRCNDVSIQNNEVYDNKLHGIMLHRSSDNGIIRNNTVTNSGDACIALFESFGKREKEGSNLHSDIVTSCPVHAL